MKQTQTRAHPDLNWEVPAYDQTIFLPKRHDYALIIPVLNEGDRIHTQLKKIKDLALACDVILVDGGSTDGSIRMEDFRSYGLRACLTKKGPGRLSAQLRVGLAFILQEDYKGTVLIDGNNKDNPVKVPAFIDALRLGFDHVQGSRFLPGGHHENTPASRSFGIRFVHAPLISMAGGFRYTDTTNGFKAYSPKFLLDPRVLPFRNIFNSYELHSYLAIRAAELGMRVMEIPVERVYPHGKVPTKISKFRGSVLMLKILFKAFLHHYDP